ncbi:putative glucarate transporter [Carnimonas sp. LMG 33810]
MGIVATFFNTPDNARWIEATGKFHTPGVAVMEDSAMSDRLPAQQHAISAQVAVSQQRSGHVRYAVLAAIFSITVFNFADRSIMSVAGVQITEHFGLSPQQLGVIFSGFSWAYAIGQFPGGWLLDRFGAKRIYGLSIILWSVFTLLQGLVDSIASMGIDAVAAFFLLRFMLGIVESPAFPANSRIVATWFPIAERGFASSLFASAQYFAVVLFTPLMAWMTHAFGWQHLFLWMGLVGIVLGILWFVGYSDPSRNKWLGEAEKQWMREGDALVDLEAERRSHGAGLQWRDVACLFTSRMLWGIYLGQYCITALTSFFITWFPIYLVQSRGMSIVDAGMVAALPAMGGCTGGVLGGLFSDVLIRRGVPSSPARKMPFVIGMALSTTLVLSNYVSGDPAVIALMALAFFGKGFAAVGWGMIADTAPKDMMGLASGIFNGIGNLSGVLTPVVIGYVVALTHSFDDALWFVAAHALLAIVAVVVAGRFHRLSSPSEQRPLYCR